MFLTYNILVSAVNPRRSSLSYRIVRLHAPIQCISRHVRKVRFFVSTSFIQLRLLVSYKTVSFEIGTDQS